MWNDDNMYTENESGEISADSSREYHTVVNPGARRPSGTLVNPGASVGGGYNGPFRPEAVIGERYKIENSVHEEGAEARIFRATDLRTKEQVCIKAYIQGTHVRDEVREKLLRFRHENVANLLDWGEWEGRKYEVWTLYRGSTLLDVIRNKLFTEKEIGHYLPQMNDALQAIHSKGIVHQDIKPANFMLVGEGKNKRLVLIDFGVSSSSDKDGRSHVTKVGNTTEYAAPEVMITEFSWEESDYYSLGVTLYEMQIGSTPYSTLDKNEAMTKYEYIRSNVVPGIEKLSGRMQDLISGLMQYDQDRRWGYDAVKAWLGNNYDAYKPERAVPVPPAGKKVAEFSFQRKKYTLPGQIAELVLHMAGEWDAGEACLESDGRFSMLARRLYEVDDDLARVCLEPMRAGQDLHVHYFRKLYGLYPELEPFAWRGLLIRNYKELGQAILNALWQKDVQDAFENLNPFENQYRNREGGKLVYADLEEIFIMRVISQYLDYRKKKRLHDKISSLEEEIIKLKTGGQLDRGDVYYYKAAYLLSGSEELRLNNMKFDSKEAFVAYGNKLVENCKQSGSNDSFYEFCKLIKPSAVDPVNPGYDAWAEIVVGIDAGSFLCDV